MIGWQLCLAAVMLLGVRTQPALNDPKLLDLTVLTGQYDLDNSRQFCKLIATDADLWICQCCPLNVSDDDSLINLICNTCVYPTTTTQTNPTSTSTALPGIASTLLSTTTQNDVPTTTSADFKTSTSDSSSTKDGTSTTPTNPTPTVTTDPSTGLPTTNTTPIMSTSTDSDIDTTTPKPTTTTVDASSTHTSQFTSTLAASTSTPSTKATTVVDPTSTITIPILVGLTTDKTTTQPATVTTSTSDSTIQHLSTLTTGITLITKPTTITTLTTGQTLSTASTTFTSTPSNPSTTKVSGTSTKNTTPTSGLSSVSTQSSPTLVTFTTQTTQISEANTSSSTVQSPTIEPSTTYTASETTTDLATSTMQTNMNTSKTPPVPESSTSPTISETSTTTEEPLTLSSNAITITVAEDSTPNSKLITETSSRKTTGETEVPFSTSSEMPTTHTQTTITSTQTEETSTTSIVPSTTERIDSTNMISGTSTDRKTETSAETSSPPTSTVSVMENTSAFASTTLEKGTEDLTTTKAEEVTTSMESGTSESSTTQQPITDLSTEAMFLTMSQATYSDESTTNTILDTTSTSTVPVTQEISTTEVVISTDTPSTRPPWCDGPCPSGYIETERGCFIMVPEEFGQNFMSAFMWCRSEDRRDLSDQDDIMTSNMIETLKYMLRLNGIRSDIIYMNGHADKLMRRDKKAGLIHLEEISIWDNLPTDYVGLSTDIVNVTGICRMPKYCETPVCDLNAVYKMLPEKVEEVENKTIVQGSGIRLKCLYPSRDFLNIRCIDPGELMPSPTLLSCTIPANVKYEPPEKEVTGDMRVEDSCSDCYDDGTENCTAEGKGYVCNCKEGWNKFTCYKSVDLCPPQYCGPNGNCVTQLDEFFCNCSTGWIGDKCDVNIKKITWGGNKTLRIISSNTIASGLLGVSSGIQISLKVLSKVITDKDPEDPQEAYQAFRSTCLTMGNLAIALFQHPDLLSSEPISCRWFFFFVHICYSLAFVFMLDEVLNVCTTIHGLHRNNWVHDNKMKKKWWLDIPARIQLPFVLVFALLWYVASQGWSKIPASWTCFGVFKRETSNIWYPLVLFNFVSIVLCFGFAENARRSLSHRIQFWTANMHLVDVTNPYIRESIEKVRRNVPYCFLLPPFMFLNWLFLCWAADQQTDTVKFVSLLFSGCYAVLSMLQTLETSTGIYEYVVYYGHLYLPNCISNRILQDLTPMTWLSKAEIVAKKKKTPFNGLDASSPYHPASICYITLEHEHLMLRRMTREYLDHRVTHYSKQHEATLSVYFNELRLRHVYEKNVPLEDLHLELILETWISDTKRIDQLTIPPKAKKQKETWRTRIRAKNRIPPMENTNIRRMRFLKSIMDYHLKTLNPTLEYPVTGAMQRTDFRTFSPACPCVLRSQVEDLQRTWLPIIDIYIEQDWSLREVYKDVQVAEGYKPREEKYECKKGDLDEDHWLNELRPGFIGPRSYPLVYLPALGTYLELDYYQRFADLEWARLVKHSEYLGACYDFGR